MTTPASQAEAVALGQPLCLNPSDIPPASSTDSQFLIQAKGATTRSHVPAINWKDTATSTTSTARLSGNWFIAQTNGSTAAQQLHITYTDWDGKEQNTWLLGDATKGFAFATFSYPTDTTTTIDPTTCVSKGLCSYGSSINYVGGDGKQYSASVSGYTPPIGKPSYSTAVENSPVSFNAGGYAPGGPGQSGIKYQWRFQNAGCGIPCVRTDASTSYSDPVAGDPVSHTWATSGNFLVSLTATDPLGKQATDTFSVSVNDVPPTLNSLPPVRRSWSCATRARATSKRPWRLLAVSATPAASTMRS